MFQLAKPAWISLAVLWTLVHVSLPVPSAAEHSDSLTQIPQDGWKGELGGSSGGHTSNWAVIVSTSRYWFNYRHAADALTFYHTVRRLGIPDSNIILMLADDFACNPRNAYPGEIFNNVDHNVNLYGEAVQVDYRGTEVSVHAFLRVLTGRHGQTVPSSKRLESDSNSNVMVYLSGHGGDDFLKFQDQQEMMGTDLADAIAQMWEAGRYRNLLLFVETCEAESLTQAVSSPNTLTVATSKLGEKSYSHHSDTDVGLHVIDRVTFYTQEWFSTVGPTSEATLEQLLQYVRKQKLDSTLVWDTSRFPLPLSKVPVLDFFGSTPRVLSFPMPQPAVAPTAPKASSCPSSNDIDSGTRQRDVDTTGRNDGCGGLTKRLHSTYRMFDKRSNSSSHTSKAAIGTGIGSELWESGSHGSTETCIGAESMHWPQGQTQQPDCVLLATIAVIVILFIIPSSGT